MSQKIVYHGGDSTEVSSLEDMSASVIRYANMMQKHYEEYGHQYKRKFKGFERGQIVEYKAEAPRKAYYKERNTKYDLNKGDLCVVAEIGGPYDFCVDRIVNGEIIRYSVDAEWIKKVKK